MKPTTTTTDSTESRTKRGSDIFMHQSQRQNRQVLSEEAYRSTLSAIVQRDYFPDLGALELQSVVLDRRWLGDANGAVAARRAARVVSEREHRSMRMEKDEEQELEIRDESRGIVARKRSRPLHRETITGFHDRVTSQDDDRFDRNQKRKLQENRLSLERKYIGNALGSLPAPAIERRSLLALPPSAGGASRGYSVSGSPPSPLASDEFMPETNYKPMCERPAAEFRSALYHLPPSVPQIEPKDGEKVNKTPSMENNADMPPPPTPPKSSLALTRKICDQKKKAIRAKFPKEALVEYQPKHLTEPKINPKSTRLPIIATELQKTLLLHYDPDEHTDDDSESSFTDASTDLDASPAMSLQAEREARLFHLQKERSRLLPMTPLCTRDENRYQNNTSPPRTPVTRSPSDMPDTIHFEVEQSSFSMSGDSSRDVAARKARSILEKRGELAKSVKHKPKINNQRNQVNRSALRHSSFSRAASKLLTPAAHALLDRKSGTSSSLASSSRSRDAFSSALRQSYTLSPREKSATLASRDHAYRSTPLSSRHGSLRKAS